MTKIKGLQILVYAVFALLMIQDALPAAYKGFKEGYDDGYYAARHINLQRGQLLIGVFNGDLLTHQPQGQLQIGKDYTMQNITINADLRINNTAIAAPFWLNAVYGMVIFLSAGILLMIAITINKIIVKIAGNTMFEPACAALIKRTASLLVLYALADYAYQRIDYLKDSSMVHAPFLSVVNTASFNFQVLLCAIMVFIIAETFKQAARIKQEQDLTI